MARILICDDDIEIRDTLRRFLELFKYEVRTACDGKEAMRELDGGAFDLLITDIVMPEQDGLENIMEARRQHPTMRIIAMSGGGMVETENYLKLANALGADAVFRKPFVPKDMLKKIGEILAGEAV